MPLLLETPRLLVNQTTKSDLENYIKLYMSEDVRKLMYTRAKDAAQVAEWLQASIEHQSKYGFSVGTVIEKSSGDFIGRAGLAHIGKDADVDEVEVDCYLLKPYWRTGYGVELLQAFFNWGFTTHRINKIVATVYPINTPAQQLAVRAGMKLIGIRTYRGTDFMWYEICK